MSFECVLPGRLWTWYDEGVEVHDAHLTWFQREGADRYASGAACDQTFDDFLARGPWVDGVPPQVVEAVTVVVRAKLAALPEG